ncbi:gagpol and env protein precursor, partial [Aphelenchoides avenae]
MGLNGSPAFFQQAMNRVFEGLIGDKMIVYLDDLLCASSTWEEHVELLKEVFRRLKKAGLKLHPSKCRFGTPSVKFLGHVLCSDGIKKDADKTRALREHPIPCDVKSTQSALGIFGYYRKFVRDYARIAAPLYALTQKGVVFEWTPACQHSFETLVNLLCEDVTLAFPDFVAAATDPNRRLTIQCDASRDGLGAVLCQRDEENRMRPIYFISRLTSEAEKKYEGITVLEAAAVRFAVKKWAAYIIGLPTVVETDHIALVSMFTKDKECGNARVDKWAMEIKSRFDLHFVYKAGKTHVVADGLSRSVAKHASVSVITRSAARLLKSVQEESEEDAEHESELDNFVLEIPLSSADTPEKTRLPSVTSLPSDWDSLVAHEFKEVIHFLSPTSSRAEKILTPLALEASSFALVKGRLYKIDDTHGGKPFLRLVVPSKYRKSLFDERHSGKYGAHACGSKILAQLKVSFWWPKICADCERWARACVVCAHTRRSRKNVPPLMPIVTSRPWELLCMDILQLPKATTGEKYALVVIDHFTRFGMAFPMHDKTAELTARTLVERVFLTFGPSERIHHDKGTELLNKVMLAVVETFRMGQTTTAGYNPRCNGSCEKLNQQIIRMLSRTTVIPQEWPERISYALYVYNCTRQESTGYPPFELLFGRSARMPSEISADLIPGKYAGDIDDYRMIFAQNMSQAIEYARLKATKASERSKLSYDAAHKSLAGKYKAGDRVMVQEPAGQQVADHKLSWKYSGPYRVVKVEKNNAYLAPYGKPGAEDLEVPLDRLVKVPDEVPEVPFSKRPDRSKYIDLSAIVISLQPLKSEFSALTTGKLVFDVPIADKNWTSAAREVVIIAQKSGMGLGIYDECKGDCGTGCMGVTLADIAPDGLASEGAFGLRLVPTLAHQVAVSRAAQVIDGMELGSFCEKMLTLPAEDVDRALSCVRMELPATTPQLLAEQTRLRKEKCATTRAALELSGTRPLICITTEPDDPKPYTSLQLRDGIIGECAAGTNALGEAWEHARNDKGKPLLNDPFIIICSAGEKEAFEKSHISVITVDNMLQAVAFARQNCFGGACMAVFVTLPIVNETLLAQMVRFCKAMDAHPHVTVCFLPPPPIRTVHYGEVVAYLLREGGELYRITSDGGSTLQVGRYGTVADKGYVSNGVWTREGWQLLKVHVIHAAGWLCFQERRRNASSAPLRQMGKLELRGQNE